MECQARHYSALRPPLPLADCSVWSKDRTTRKRCLGQEKNTCKLIRKLCGRIPTKPRYIIITRFDTQTQTGSLSPKMLGAKIGTFRFEYEIDKFLISNQSPPLNPNSFLLLTSRSGDARNKVFVTSDHLMHAYKT